MAGKKKITSNPARGIATAYVPKKPVQETPTEDVKSTEVAPKPVKIPERQRSSTNTPPLEQPESREEVIARLVRRYESLNAHKAETLARELARPSEESAAHKFALTPELEQDLFRVLRKREEEDTCAIFKHYVRRKPHPLDKDRFIGEMDILYRALVQFGFEPKDVEHALSATMSANSAHVLDWLCMHVPYERMPIGFFDKYYNEEQVSIKAIAPSTDKLKEQPPTEDVQRVAEVVPEIDKHAVRKPEVETETRDQDMKFRILQAAERYYEDDEEESVNDKHAKCKLQISELESQLPSGKKKKNKKDKNAQDNQNIDVDAINKRLDALRKTLRDLEANWEFDKKLAQELFIEKQQEAAERKRKEQQLMREQRSKESTENMPHKEEEEAKKVDEEIDDFGLGAIADDDEQEGGLFGALEMETETNNTFAAVKPALRILDATPKSWKGKLPKDLLEEFCKKHDLYTRQTYSKTDLGAQRWRATVKLHPRNRHKEALTVDLPEHLAASSSRDAEHLVALAALFRLSPDSSLYRLLPPVFKDVWQEWLQGKHDKELALKLEMERKRMEFLVDLMDNSYSRRQSRQGSIGSAATPEAESPKDMEMQLRKKHEAFIRIQNEYRKRIDTDKLKKIKQKQNELPMAAYKQQVVDLVKTNQVVMISGETGCGKSTQVPQFIADAILQTMGQYGSIICTQPRRISAMSIANRVSYEMGDRSTGTKNSLVGYQIRLESKVSDENVVIFCTTGILLRRLESDRTLQGVTHVIVDEVHERSIESDFLLIILKRLCQARPDLRVILMSATVKAERFVEYFGNCPVISVPGRTFPVSVNFLEDVVQRTGYVLESDSPFAKRCSTIRKDQGTIELTGKHGTTQKMRLDWYEDEADDEYPYDPVSASIGKVRLESDITQNEDEDNDQQASEQKYSKQTLKMIRRMDENKINYDLILSLLEHICLHPQQDLPGTGAILVFLPGMPEIRKLYDILSSHAILGKSEKYLLIPLHSTLSSEHQEKAFETPPEGIRKIVLSTNIAETGVTISDVTVVIDTGMAKVVSYDQARRVSQLQQTFIAKANAQQRRGRAGRVQEGVCFHLFTQERFEKMADFEAPEILRLPLEEICLRIKICGLGSIREVLDAALDRPSEKMINNAIQTLQEVQALSLDEELTPLGAHLADLPVDVHIGKMILFGAIFRCLDPVLTIAAALSFKSPFVRPFGKEAEADLARARYRYADSDFWAIYNAYGAWRKTLHEFKGTPGWRRKVRAFCEANFLSQKNLEMIEEMKRQYFGLLASIGFVKTQDLDDLVERYDVKDTKMCPVPQQYNVCSSSVPVVNAAITAGLYPKFAERRGKESFYHDSLSLKIHPSSLLFGRERVLPTDFLVYNTVVMSRDTVYMWETAAIDAVTIMLLAANMDIRHKQKRVVLDHWLTFECFARTAVLIKFLRTELNNWLSAKMRQPELEMDSAIMDCMVKILELKMEKAEM